MTDSQNIAETLSESLSGKAVVTDTSSLLIAGTQLLNILSKCQIVIPAIVITELEHKRSSSTLGHLSRDWLRLIEEERVKHGSKLSEGVKLVGYNNVYLRVEPNHSSQKSLPAHLQDGSNDSTILAVANNLKLDKKSEIHEDYSDVVVLSNDIPVRIKATLDLNLQAYDFNATQIFKVKPFNGVYEVELFEDEYAEHAQELGAATDRISEDLTNLLYSKLPSDAASSGVIKLTYANQKVNKDLMFTDTGIWFVKHKTKAHGVVGKTSEQDAALQFLALDAENVPIVSVSGGAGTGKTLLTVATAVDQLKASKYEKIVVFRSLHEMGQGQEMGFLPGDVGEKMEAWAGALLDAIDVLVKKNKPLKKNATIADIENQKKVAAYYRAMIAVEPITYLRGRSIANTFIILDEAQNFSRSELLNIISRVGEGSKIVLLFDSAQVDNRYLSSGKNADIWSVVNELKESELFAHVTLTKTERSRVAELASSLLEKG